jgi:hypothetical protein
MLAARADHEEPGPSLRRTVVGSVYELEAACVSHSFECGLDRLQNSSRPTIRAFGSHQTGNILEKNKARIELRSKTDEFEKEAAARIA